MRIGAVNAINNIPNTYSTSAVRMKHTQRTQSADIVGKKLQNEIADKQQKKNGLSSDANMPVQERASKNIELQNGISNLKAQLRRHEIETGDNQNKPDDGKNTVISDEIAKEASAKAAKEEARKEALKEEIQKEAEKKAEIKEAEKESAAKEERKAEEAKAAEKTENDTRSIAASDMAKNQIEERNSVIAKTEAGIAIKKGEIRQDEALGADTTDKKEEINSQERRAGFISNLTIGPKGINNGAGSMKVSGDNIPAQNQNVIHAGNDGIVLLKTG